MSWNHNFVRFYFSSVSKVCPFPPWHGFMSQVVKIIKLPVFSRSQYDYINFINFIFCEDVKSKCCFVAWPACWSAMYHASMLKESHGFLFWYLSVYCGGGAERWWSKANRRSKVRYHAKRVAGVVCAHFLVVTQDGIQTVPLVLDWSVQCKCV